MKTALFTSLACAMLFTYGLYAQEESMRLQASGGGGFTIGYGNMDVSDFQAFLPADTRTLKDDHLVIGGTGHAYLGRLVIGGGGAGLLGDDIVTDSLDISLGGGYGTFDLGYLILNREHVKFFPMLGIGGAGYGISIARNENVSVDNVRNNPAREIDIKKGSIVADVSLNLNLIPFLEYDEKEDSFGGFMAGLKVGYLYSLPSSDWRFTGGDITGGPDFGLNMLYFQVVIGGFGFQNPDG